MFHPKIQMFREIGFFTPRMAQRNFIRNNINYFCEDPIAPLFFTEETKQFLLSLSDLDYLKLYLNIEKYLTYNEWCVFKQTIINDNVLQYKLVNIVDLKAEILPIDLLIPIMTDYVLISHVPTAYVLRVLNSNDEFRQEIANYPAIVDFLTNRSRAQAFIWGDLLPFPFLPEEGTAGHDPLLRPMRNLHL